MTDDLLTPAEWAEIRKETAKKEADKKDAFCKAFADEQLSVSDLQKVIEVCPDLLRNWIAFRAFMNSEKKRGGITMIEMTRLIAEKKPFYPMFKRPEMEERLLISHQPFTIQQIKQRILQQRNQMVDLMEIIKFAKDCHTDKGFDVETFKIVQCIPVSQLFGILKIAEHYKNKGLTCANYVKIVRNSKNPELMANPFWVIPAVDENLKRAEDLLTPQDMLTFLAYEPLWGKTGIDLHLKNVRQLKNPQEFIKKAVEHPELLKTAAETLQAEKEPPKPKVEETKDKKEIKKRVPKIPKKVLTPLEKLMKRPDVEEMAQKVDTTKLLGYVATLLIVLGDRANHDQKTKQNLIDLKNEMVEIYGR